MTRTRGLLIRSRFKAIFSNLHSTQKLPQSPHGYWHLTGPLICPYCSLSATISVQFPALFLQSSTEKSPGYSIEIQIQNREVCVGSDKQTTSAELRRDTDALILYLFFAGRVIFPSTMFCNVSGKNLCSWRRTRAARISAVSVGSTGTRACAITGPVS